MTAKAKLSDDQVDEIRALKAADAALTNAELGRRFGVDASQISRLLNRKSRSEAPPEIPLAMIPWGRITPNVRNVRSSMAENTDEALADLEGLASSILDLGLLQPLRVEPIERRAVDGATHVLVDGHRRWRAMQMLVQRGKIPADEPVPVIIGGGHDEPADLTLEQLAANLARRAMHPLDEAEAFRRLVEGGIGTEAISRCVGRTQRYVQARLLLARRLGDPAKQALRDGAVTLAQAEALTDADEGQQKHVLRQIHRFPTEASIRAFLRPERKDPAPRTGDRPGGEPPLPSVSDMINRHDVEQELANAVRDVRVGDERRPPAPQPIIDDDADDGLDEDGVPIDPAPAGPANDAAGETFSPLRHFRVVDAVPGPDNMPKTLTIENIISGRRATYDRSLADIPAFLRRAGDA